MLRSERLKNIELLILDRPDAGNSISSELTTALLEKLERLKSDTDLHALIITGAGDKFFCTGGDIKQYQLIKEAGEWKLGKNQSKALPPKTGL